MHQEQTAAAFSQEALEVALGEVRNVMNQYSNVVDPSESAAKKERYRLSEEQGDLAENVAQMVRASLAQSVVEQPAIISREKIPLS